MFGWFQKKREYIKAANEIGKEVHRQIRKTLEVKGPCLNTPDEMVFIAGYLETFVSASAIGKNKEKSDISKEYIKQICDGVIPGRLWDVYQRGSAMSMLAQGGEREEFVTASEIYNLGKLVAVNDSDKFFANKIAPQGLQDFLLRKN